MYDNEDSICGIIYNDEPYYFRKNLQGDIIAIVDKDTKEIARYSYDAWGACTIVSSSNIIAHANPFRYRGYYYDIESNLYYLNSRYYDPAVGRFINSDETVYTILGMVPNGFDLFTYCKNNPISCNDFTGYYCYNYNNDSIRINNLKNESWLFKMASNLGMNLVAPNLLKPETIISINLLLVKLIIQISMGYTKNYKAGIAFNFSTDNIGISSNLGLGKGYSLAYSYSISWTTISRSMSLVYASKNDGLYVSLDVEIQINHIATAAVAAACVYLPQLYPVLMSMLVKSAGAAVAAIQLLVPILKQLYA